MLRFIYRQRRRLMFSGFFGTLSLMALAITMEGGLASFPFDNWIFIATIAITSLVVGICVAGAAALVVLIFPSWRAMIEQLSLSGFILAILSILAPATFELPYIGAFLPFIVMMSVYALTYGEFSDRFRLMVDHPETRRFKSPKTAEELWVELVPDAGTLSEHWDALLCELDPDSEDPDSIQAKYTHGGSFYELQTMTFLEKEVPFHAKYHHLGDVDPRNRSLVEGTYEIRIAPREGKEGCIVTLTSRHNSMLLRTALLRWFDDELGDKTDHLRASHLGRRDWSMTGRYRRKVMQFA